MTSQESKDTILNYIIERMGKATKNDVVKYMDKSKDVRGEYRTSRVTTLKLIDELESDNRIKVLKGERKGQSHLLIFNHESEFNQINKKLVIMKQLVEKLPFAEIVKPRRGRPWTWTTDEDIVLWGLLKLLARTAQILYKKIIELLLTMTMKKSLAMKERYE